MQRALEQSTPKDRRQSPEPTVLAVGTVGVVGGGDEGSEELKQDVRRLES